LLAFLPLSVSILRGKHRASEDEVFMNRKYRLRVIGYGLIAAVGVMAVQLAGAATPDIAGWWIDGSHRGAILIKPCGDQLCGSVEWLKIPNDPATGKPKTDYKNGDPALRSRPLCGLQLLWGFVHASDPTLWEGGKIYDPESGNTYNARMILKPDGTLDVRGYIGIPLLGRSETWVRPTEELTACSAG
jgi:uncharacterized protein (DUF2147 family)